MNKLLRFIVLIFLSVILIACASRDEGSGNQQVDSTVLKANRDIELLQYPFFSGFTSYATITDPLLIRRLLSQIIESNLYANLYASKIEAIHVNSINNFFIIYLRVAFDNLINKENILEFANMTQEGETDRYWSLVDSRFGTLFFDLAYKNTIVLTNIDIITYEAFEFDWVPQNYSLSLLELGDSDFWLWSSNLDVTSSFSFENNLFPEWGLLSSKGKDVDGYVSTSIVIPFSGARQDKATIKLVLPSILRNFEVKDNATLPFLETEENVLLVEGIYIAPSNLNEYLSNIIKTNL